MINTNVIGWSNELNINDQGFTKAWNDKLIKQSLETLINTTPGERVLFKSYGCNLKKYNFEIMNELTIQKIQQEIYQSIQKHETRLIDFEVTVREQDEKVLCDVSYSTKWGSNHTTINLKL
ncbi:GPW/gp25 family protein [Flammeovirga pacifica]|uniref:IraD/Gp25-like domain-containing protein n=1 Tax=Flammeovirga pacifica TaxID=915059 RepID=A0A1S1YVC0_FLAPC|nr:GPW/gp25 family protein [Flammeovirga pacifica]OHX64957.1 hypothetical protein NH26_00640 [Flammeovirga pacifica]